LPLESPHTPVGKLRVELVATPSENGVDAPVPRIVVRVEMDAARDLNTLFPTTALLLLYYIFNIIQVK
jgi:hypothetical protein